MHKRTAHLQRKELNPEISLFTCSTLWYFNCCKRLVWTVMYSQYVFVGVPLHTVRIACWFSKATTHWGNFCTLDGIDSQTVNQTIRESENSENFDSETSKLQPVNLSETFRYCWCTSEGGRLFAKFIMSLLFVTTQSLKCNERLINGLFHTKCLDVHTNEKIIILKLALSK